MGQGGERGFRPGAEQLWCGDPLNVTSLSPVLAHGHVQAGCDYTLLLVTRTRHNNLAGISTLAEAACYVT